MNLTLVLMLGAAVLVSLLLARLGKMNLKETVLQTLGMGAAALAFFGLILLMENFGH
ncbi:MAG: hypothetical protein J4G03_02505 [Gemmatimonadetes bacterium]|nr:hypothetical protein [Gemmatimonadota bacterium]